MAKPPPLDAAVRVLRLTYVELTALLPLADAEMRLALTRITTRLLRTLNRADPNGRWRRPPRS